MSMPSRDVLNDTPCSGNALSRLSPYTSAAEAHGWSRLLWSRAQQIFGPTTLPHKGLSVSTAYSGIGAPELALRMLCSAIGIGCTPLAAFEKKTACKAELRATSASCCESPCIFSDIVQTVAAPDVRRLCGLLLA